MSDIGTISIPDFGDQILGSDHRIHAQEGFDQLIFDASSISIRPITVPVVLMSDIGTISIPDLGDLQFLGSDYRIHIQEVAGQLEFDASSISIIPASIPVTLMSDIGAISVSDFGDQILGSDYRLHVQEVAGQLEFDVQETSVKAIDSTISIFGSLGAVDVASPNQFGESQYRSHLSEEFEYVETEVSGIGMSNIENILVVQSEIGPIELELTAINFSTLTTGESSYLE
jgi:hypothetical protein